VAAELVVAVGEIGVAMWQGALWHCRARFEFHRHRVLKVLLLCCALQLVGCIREQQPSPEIISEIQRLEQRTISPDSSLQKAASIRKQTMSVKADWQVRISSTTKEYFNWVKQQSGPDYQVLSQTESALSMRKTLPGDSYTVEFRSNSSGSNIDVHFFATGD
jgi:hypothetical protein